MIEKGKKIMTDKYTGLLHFKHGKNVQNDFYSIDQFKRQMGEDSDIIKWARLFDSDTGEEVACYPEIDFKKG